MENLPLSARLLDGRKRKFGLNPYHKEYMHTDLTKIDKEDFELRECEFGGDACVWVYPNKQGIKWNSDNAIFRSSIWRASDGKLISAGFKKFFNLGEHPAIFPAPEKINSNHRFIEKLDGSCLIVSKLNGELITRTRRALTTFHLNGEEIAGFVTKYPKAFDFEGVATPEYSLIFEWTTPSNRIVLDYGPPDIKLIGKINHTDYSYETQEELDVLAAKLGVGRPKVYSFKSVEELKAQVLEWKGLEGVCWYYGRQQQIRKTKSNWYNLLHTFKGQMSLKNLTEIYVSEGMPTYPEFMDYLLESFGYEGQQLASSLVSEICDAKRTVDAIINGMQKFIDTQCTPLSNRKLQAEKIFSAYGKTNRATIVFLLLDKKPVDPDLYTKLILQSIISK